MIKIKHSMFQVLPLLLLINTICGCATVFAQDFRDGYVVTLDRDTIYGQVNYSTQSKHYKVCEFKNGSNRQDYQPNQLMAYGFIADRRYLAGIRDDHFVEVLVQGPLNLYKLKEVFMVDKNSEVIELDPPVKELVTAEGERGYREDKQWLHTLAYTISDCDKSWENKLKSLKYSEKDLTSLVTQYNICKGGRTIVSKDSKKWYQINLGLAAGMMDSQLRPENYDDYNESVGIKDSYQSMNPFVGLIFELTSPRVSNRISFQLETQLFSAGFSQSTEIPFTQYEEFHEANLELTALSFPFSIAYAIPINRNELSLNLGGNFDHLLKYESQRTVYLIKEGETLSTTELDFMHPKNMLGAWGSIGYQRKFKKFDIGLRLKYNHLDSDVNTERTSLSLFVIQN